MKRLSALLRTAPLILLAAASSPARADYMNWSYTTTATPPVVTSGTGSVQLTGVTTGAAAASIPILGIQDSSAATAGSPDVYNSHFSVNMTVTDNATNDSKTLTLTGLLSGNLTATTSSVVASFTGPNSVTLDGHVYTLNIPSLTLTASGAPQQTLTGNITVANAPSNPPPLVNPQPPPVNPGGSGGGVQGAPEPTSLVLGGLGCSLLSLGSWWKGRRRLTPAAA